MKSTEEKVESQVEIKSAQTKLKEEKKVETAKKKKTYITVLSIIACIAVIYMHVNDTFHGFGKGFRWDSANVIESFCYFAVPIFFMISGSTLLDYRERYDTKTFFKKRLLKTLIPFLIWTAFYVIYNLIFSPPEAITFKWFVDCLFNTKIQPVYWFFIPLFACYMAIPVISLIPKEKRQSIFKYVIILGLITISILPLVFRLAGLTYNYGLSMPILGCQYLLYVFIGYYLDNYKLSKGFKITTYVVGVLGLITMIVGTYFMSYATNSVSGVFKVCYELPNLAWASSIFLLFKSLSETKFMDKMYKLTNWFSDCTFGVYLIHMTIFLLLRRILPFDTTHILFRLFAPIGIFLICSLIVKLIKKIPFIRNIVP